MLDFSNPWIITETNFDSNALGKVEANFCLGNGYLGLRSATEEKYLGETRDLLVAGTFDQFSEEEVTELPNAADVTNIEITLNDCRFDLTQGTIQSYERAIDLKTGLLTRDVVWISPKGETYILKFERIVSLKRLHTIALRVSIIPKSDAKITFQSGIDGRVTCDGSQHFTEGQTRFYDKKYLQYVPRTIQSDITFVLNATHRFTVDGAEIVPTSDINILRRRMFSKFTLDVKAGQTLILEKYANVYTTRDKEAEGHTVADIQAYALEQLKSDEAAGFTALADESAATWQEKVWDRVPIEIEGSGCDQLMIRFAQYHMQLMTPAHDNRMNIGAKGFSGEGYKGHTFWDTEIFLLPYFIFTMPEVARSLEEYRYLSLPGAHTKARHNGYLYCPFILCYDYAAKRRRCSPDQFREHLPFQFIARGGVDVMRARTIHEAASYFRETDPQTCLTETAIRRLIRSEVVPSVRVGRKYLVTVEALEAYLSGAIQPPAKAQSVKVWKIE